MPPRKPRERPDRIVQAQAHGEAWRQVSEGRAISAIVADIRQLMGDRSHLLVEVAGISAGSWAAQPSTLSTELVVAGILLQAAGPVDRADLNRWVQVGRERALAPPHVAW